MWFGGLSIPVEASAWQTPAYASNRVPNDKWFSSPWEPLVWRHNQPKSKMKRTTLLAAIACFALAPGAFAQPNNSMLYQPSVDLTSLSQNGFTGVVGGVFYTPY